MGNLEQIISNIKNIKMENIVDILIVLLIILTFKLLSSAFAYIIVKLFYIKEKNKKVIQSSSFYKPLKIFFTALGIYLGLMTLSLPENIVYTVTKIFKICIIILTTNAFANIFDNKSSVNKKIRNKLDFSTDDTAINYINKIVRGFIYIVGGFITISELGYNLNGVATGIGIGAAALALAAQDFSKGILAGISIITDKPFKIGDYIEFNNISGTVEDITLKTTRIRDINTQLVVVPNSVIVESSIFNGTKRKTRRYLLDLVLELDTSLEKVSILNEQIRKLLNDNLNVLKEDIKVFFDTVSDDGINIKIRCYTNILEYNEFLKFKENLNYEIIKIIEKEKIALAYPSQTIYIKK